MSLGGKKDEAHILSSFPGSLDRGMLEEVGGSLVEEGHELHQSQGQVPHCLQQQRRTPFCHPFRPPAVLSACDSFQTTQWSSTGTSCTAEVRLRHITTCLLPLLGGFCFSGLAAIGFCLVYPSGSLFAFIPSSLGYRKIMDFYKSCNTTSSTRQLTVQASSLETPKSNDHTCISSKRPPCPAPPSPCPRSESWSGGEKTHPPSVGRWWHTVHQRKRRKQENTCLVVLSILLVNCKRKKPTRKSPWLGIPRATTLTRVRC